MAVAYITRGDSISAARMTALFAEFDRKLTQLLSYKSPFLFQDATKIDELRALLGVPYYFCNGEVLPYLEAWGAENYDHVKFRTWRDALTEGIEGVITRDETNKTTICTPADPPVVDLGIYGNGDSQGDFSLEALRLGAYYIAELSQQRLVVGYQQKRYRYAVAEMVYEGRGYENVLIYTDWNKFNFFRFHNLNPYEMTVRFQGVTETIQEGNPPGTITVEAYGCRAVRRDTALTGYDATYRYFWKFNPRDPRGYAFPRASLSVWTSQSANPVMNPCILYDWVAHFERDNLEGGVCFYRDKHAVYDIGSIYADYFASSTNRAALIGDLLHHKGTIRTLYTEGDEFRTKDVEFNGYATIEADMAQGSITVADDGDALTLSTSLNNGEIHAIGSNLFDGSSGTESGTRLMTTKPEGAVQPLAQGAVTREFNYSTLDETGTTVIESVSLEYTGLVYVQSTNTNPLPIWKTTVGQVETLNHFGSDDYKFTQQDSDFGTFTERTFRQTIRGLKLHFTQRFYVMGAFSQEGAQDVLGVVQLDNSSAWGATPLQASLFGGTSIALIKREISFDGYGWPESTSRAPAFLTPRRDRAYSDPKYNTDGGLPDYRHPNFTGLPVAPDGGDFGVTWNGCNYRTAGVRALTPIEQVVWPYSQYPVWENPDDLLSVVETNGQTDLSSVMPRLFLLRELYNDMAATVNSITGCFPLDYRLLLVDMGDGTVARLEANSLGITLSSLRPINQFASFGNGSTMHRLCVKLGIPIKTENDFPQSYRDFLAASKTSWALIFHKQAPYTLEASPEEGPYSAFYSVQTGAVFGQEPYLWVTIEDVREVIQNLGWRFVYRELSAPWTLEHFSLTPSILWEQRQDSDSEAIPTSAFVGLVPGDIWALMPASANAEWKTSQSTPTIADYRPGDVLGFSFGTFDSVQGQDYVFVDAGAPPELAAEFPQCRQQQMPYRRTVVYQRYVSGSSLFGIPIANGTQVVRCGVPWIGHPSEDFSAESAENAFIASRVGLPLEAKGAMATPSNAIPTEDNGETYISESEGSGAAHEVALFLADQIALT